MAYVLLSPLTWALLLAVLLVSTWCRLRRGWQAMAVAGALCLWLLAAPLGANLLQGWLESMVSGTARCSSTDRGPIVVLSGGYERLPVGPDDFLAFRFETWRRVRAGTDAWHRTGRGPFWIAGGGPYAFKESALQARLARGWGVPDASMQIETESTTTWQSAFVMRRLVTGKVRLVTSPAHQVRSLLAFRAAGFDACAIDVGTERATFAGLPSLWPQVSSLEKAEMALYELAGLVLYRVRLWRMESGSVVA